MTNKEKAKEIELSVQLRSICVGSNEFEAAIQMAIWKDQQFKEYLEKNKQPVLASETDDTVVGYSIDVDRIIKEFFKETD